MSVSLNGINEKYITFCANGTLTEGLPVKMYSNNTVAACSDGDQVIGIVKSVRNGYATVQVSGTVTLGYTGTAPTVGLRIIDADGSGGVSIASSGRQVLVVSVDTTAAKVTAIM